MLWIYKSIPCTVRLHCCHLVLDDRKGELAFGVDTTSHILNIQQLLRMSVQRRRVEPGLELPVSNSSSSSLGRVSHLRKEGVHYVGETSIRAALSACARPCSLATASECL